MAKTLKSILCIALAVLMLVSFAACAKPVEKDADPDELNEEQLYDETLGEFYEAYTKAKAEATTVSERYALMAIAEAKMLESGIMLPMQSNGGNYAISKVAPYTITPVLWGNDSYRYHDALVATTLIKKADRDALKSLYAEKKGTGTYLTEAKAYLAGKGYELQRTYTLGYTSDPETFDQFQTSNAADSEVLVNTYDGLLEYDVENQLKGALATEWTTSEDGLTWTFKLRQGAKWVDSTGKELAEVTADDFVAGFQHMLDDPEGGLEWLVEGVIKGVTEYVGGEATFDEVGVKATDDYTVVYTLEAPCTYFDTMFGYGVFAPLNRAYYESLGGTFGPDSESGTYGTDKDHIAYNGPYIISTFVSENTIVFTKNESYWNKDNINIDKITWIYNDGKVATQAYDDYKAGILDGCGLNSAALEKAKADGLFEDYGYVSGTDATSFPAFLNVYRRGFANCNDATALVSNQTDDVKARTKAAMFNQNFRLAICFAFDRGMYMEQSVGADLKYTSMVNSYTPGTFVTLTEETTVEINGTAKTYPAGTFYGAIMQDQITADGYPIKVFDPTQDGGIGSSAGFDGWYNADAAKEYLEKAIKVLAEEGVEVSAENPIHLDYPYQDDGSVSTARANVLKTSVEEALEGKVIIDLVATTDRTAYLYAAYYFNAGSEANYNISTLSGWGPDYGDPSTYLDTMIKGGGYMLKCIGLES